MATPVAGFGEGETTGSDVPIGSRAGESFTPLGKAAIVAHIEEQLGPVAGVYREPVAGRPPLAVQLVAPSAELPFYTLVTSGMSEQPMQVPPEATPAQAPPYAELCLLLPSTWPFPTDLAELPPAVADEAVYWPIRWLLLLARLPHEYHTWLGFGHSVPNGEDAAPFAANTELGCLLVLTAISLPEEFQTLTLASGKLIQFYTLYPLYREEMELKKALGVDALLDRFITHDISDVLDLSRPNVALT